MASTPGSSFSVPFRDQLTTSIGLLSRPWEYFFRSVFERLLPLGIERSFEIENNISTAKDIKGLNFSSSGVSMAVVDCLIQRVTTGTDAVELIEYVSLLAVFKPTSEEWSLSVLSEENPDDSGVTFSITATGQVKYTSTEITGTKQISKLYFRARTLAGKSTLYSSVGAR